MIIALVAPFPSTASNESNAATTHPLIMLSHGTGGNNLTHHELAAATARSGYIVAALTHPGDNFRDRSIVGSPKYLSECPRQVSAQSTRCRRTPLGSHASMPHALDFSVIRLAD